MIAVMAWGVTLQYLLESIGTTIKVWIYPSQGMMY